MIEDLILFILGENLIQKFKRRKFLFYCPVCMKKIPFWKCFIRQIDTGKFVEEHEPRKCPECNSLERTRHFAIYLKKFRILESKPKFLHFAPEEVLTDNLRDQLQSNYITTDLNMNGVDFREDITSMNFENNTFDFIYCSNVLEHIEDDNLAMQELFRVLKPKGQALIQVPIKGDKTYENPEITEPADRYKHFGQADHVRYYGRDISERLEKVGFEVKPFTMLEKLELTSKQIHCMNLNKKELVHLCLKP